MSSHQAAGLLVQVEGLNLQGKQTEEVVALTGSSIDPVAVTSNATLAADLVEQGKPTKQAAPLREKRVEETTQADLKAVAGAHTEKETKETASHYDGDKETYRMILCIKEQITEEKSFEDANKALLSQFGKTLPASTEWKLLKDMINASVWETGDTVSPIGLMMVQRLVENSMSEHEPFFTDLEKHYLGPWRKNKGDEERRMREEGGWD